MNSDFTLIEGLLLNFTWKISQKFIIIIMKAIMPNILFTNYCNQCKFSLKVLKKIPQLITGKVFD